MGKKVKKILDKHGKPVRWDQSLTREMLKHDIKEKTITRETSLEDAYNHRPEFQYYDEEKFEEHLEKLLSDAEDRDKRAARDDSAVKQFRKIHPPRAKNHWGEPRWEGSLAEKSLHKDMEKGRHKKFKPEKLRGKRDEYKQFGKTTFRNHIYQKTRADKFQNYLNDKSQEENEWMQRETGEGEDETMWTFDEILSHKKTKGKTLLKVKWSNGDVTWEPLSVMAEDDPISCMRYGKTNKLLDDPHWSHLKPLSKKANKRKT